MNQYAIWVHHNEWPSYSYSKSQRMKIDLKSVANTSLLFIHKMYNYPFCVFLHTLVLLV